MEGLLHDKFGRLQQRFWADNRHVISWLNLKKAEAYRTLTKSLNTQKLCFIIDRSSVFVSISSAEPHSYFLSSSWSLCEPQALLSSSLQQHETSGQLSLAHGAQGQISGWQHYYLLDGCSFLWTGKTALSFPLGSRNLEENAIWKPRLAIVQCPWRIWF